MTNPQHPLRENGGNPILAIQRGGFTTLVTTYWFHSRIYSIGSHVKGKSNKRYHIPGCSDIVLEYLARMVSQGWKEYWINGVCHVIHSDDHVTFQTLTN